MITAYQAAETVAEAVRSALEQTLPALETIVVDDGSTDDLDSALAPFRDRIKLVRQANGGGASARNAGAAAASGEFMAILDADDAYGPGRIEALTELATARPDLDLVTTDARFVVEGRSVGTFASHNPFATSDQRTAIFESCFVGGWPAVRLTRLSAIGGFDEAMRIGYDWDCWLRVILDGGLAGMVDAPHYDYMLHGGSLSAARVASLWERVRLLAKARDNPSLRPEERSELERNLRRRRTLAVVGEVQAAIYHGGSRPRLLRRALSPGIEARTRALAVVGSVAPPLARRVLPDDRPPEERFPAEA